MIPHVKISSLSDAADTIVNILTNIDEVLLEVVIFIFGIVLIPLGLALGFIHDFTVELLSVTPVPGEEGADEFYIFSSPEEGNLFYTLNGFMDAYIEPIALLLIFFGIALLLFLRIFDIVIDDFGLDTTEAKQKLFIAPLLIVLWIPIANLVLYFSFGMTEFFSNFSFPGIDELGDSVAEGDAMTDTDDGLTIQSYLSAIMPESVIGGGQVDVYSSIFTLILAYLAFFPAALIYIVSLLGAFICCSDIYCFSTRCYYSCSTFILPISDRTRSNYALGI